MLTKSQLKHLLGLIQSDELYAFFEQIENYNITTPQLERFKKEFVNGENKHDYYDRLKLHIKSLVLSKEEPRLRNINELISSLPTPQFIENFNVKKIAIILFICFISIFLLITLFNLESLSRYKTSLFPTDSSFPYEYPITVLAAAIVLLGIYFAYKKN